MAGGSVSNADQGVVLVDAAYQGVQGGFALITAEIDAFQNRQQLAPPELIKRASAYLSAAASTFAPSGPLASEIRGRGALSDAAVTRLAAYASNIQAGVAAYEEMLASDATWAGQRAAAVTEADAAVNENWTQAMTARENAVRDGIQGVNEALFNDYPA